jgi:hypothetical protein
MITLSALAATFLLDRQTRLPIRVFLSVAALIGVGVAIATIRSTFQIDVANANVVSDVLAGREAILQTEDAGRTAVHGSYPVRVLSLLLRPFFYDAGGALGLVVSFENALLAVILGVLAYHWRAVKTLTMAVPYLRFALTSSVAILLLLALGYYNVGLGIRQKATMILPGILVAFITLRAVLDARRVTAPAIVPLVPAPPGMPVAAGSNLIASAAPR